ncbi:fucolectin-like [Puntigrus tetrazona]|uniref:fucolectin-like n=1 Tax=Puntigrus tetrazona TaxID=1606681 RepID=UPI001C8A1E68|nr:fucolectin-like [Puntigrus tetrazona]
MKKLYECLWISLGFLSIQETANGTDENAAFWRNTSQSSTWDSLWSSSNAVDGSRTTCSHTISQTEPWWRVDLLNEYQVKSVAITNRDNCCPEQINGAEIRIGNSLENNGNNNPICSVIAAIPAGQSYSFSCNGLEGRYVNLIIPGDMKILTLCEVEVFGKGPVLKRSIVRMMFNSREDLTDPKMKENLIMRLGSALADRGLTNVTLSWIQSPKQVIQKVNAPKRCIKVL